MANAVSGQLVVASLPDRLRVRATQNVDHMIQPKSKSAFRVDAMDAREKFLRRNRAVECLAWCETIIAAFARCRCVFFAEISEQSHASALASLSVMDYLLELRSGDSRFALALFVDEMELLGDIACTEQQHAFARQSVPAGAPCLLIIALQIFRQVVMQNETDIRLINAHSERDR